MRQKRQVFTLTVIVVLELASSQKAESKKVENYTSKCWQRTVSSALTCCLVVRGRLFKMQTTGALDLDKALAK